MLKKRKSAWSKLNMYLTKKKSKARECTNTGSFKKKKIKKAYKNNLQHFSFRRANSSAKPQHVTKKVTL